MPSVYEKLEDAVEVAGAGIVSSVEGGWGDTDLLLKARSFAVVKAKLDGAIAILSEMEGDDELENVTVTPPPVWESCVLENFVRGHKHAGKSDVNSGLPFTDEADEGKKVSPMKHSLFDKEYFKRPEVWTSMKKATGWVADEADKDDCKAVD